MSENRGIPTLYAGTRFRSRLEARWAAFFDLAGWRWEYEPFDLNGWIPDFALIGHRGQMALVEVKPTLHCDQAVLDKALKGIDGQNYDFLFCGVSLIRNKLIDDPWFDIVGLHSYTVYDRVAPWFKDKPPQPRYRDIWQWPGGGLDMVFGGDPYWFHFRPENADTNLYNIPDGKRAHEGWFNDVEPLWREAGNKVQWKAPAR